MEGKREKEREVKEDRTKERRRVVRRGEGKGLEEGR